ncbi:MAG: type II toxin-antitoxin system Y4mF family antitoxin [Corynebacterium sp.]|uniref:type II toxin-antitoxin system Y4mF family antitoxin n=1 Tax=Corynebacterium sp. TaxID=1720 RepID=UPI0026DBE626|nr:type II toxin-antitoxin system Y4mF family antitoxin [Corynebacterium sp.]MDO5099202.1 type II toxin-antitoxin system Y4mF family antitoxin [Corynebacterium sp.]
MDINEIAATLRDKRKLTRLTQAEIAAYAGVSERFVREAEKGKATLRLDKLLALVDALGLTLTVNQQVPGYLRKDT